MTSVSPIADENRTVVAVDENAESAVITNGVDGVHVGGLLVFFKQCVM